MTVLGAWKTRCYQYSKAFLLSVMNVHGASLAARSWQKKPECSPDPCSSPMLTSVQVMTVSLRAVVITHLLLEEEKVFPEKNVCRSLVRSCVPSSSPVPSKSLLEHNVTEQLIPMKWFSEWLENLLCCRIQLSEMLLSICNSPKMVLLLWYDQINVPAQN